MRSELRRQLDLKTLQIEESIKVGRREIGTLERALQDASTQKISHEVSFRKVKERILGGVGGESVALQVLALKGLGSKLKTEADALSTISQKMQILQSQKKAKADSLVAQSTTLEKIRGTIVTDDRLQNATRESAELESLVEVGSARHAATLESEAGDGTALQEISQLRPESPITDPIPSAGVPTEPANQTRDSSSFPVEQRELQWSTDSRSQNEGTQQSPPSEPSGDAQGTAASSVRDFQEQIETIESWSSLSNSGVDLTYVSDTGSRIGMQIVGGNGVPVRVILTPRTAADQRALFNQKQNILESLRSKGVSVREVVVSGGERT